MRYLKSYNENLDINSIESICKKYRIRNYNINSDGSITVDGNVNLSNKSLIIIPIKFKLVSGVFDCSHNRLTTLFGSPLMLGDNFNCNNNSLKTLEYSPQRVDGWFDCSYNELITLKGSPKKIGGPFDCSGNRLRTLEFGPEIVGDGYYCNYNEIQTLKWMPREFRYFFGERNRLPKILLSNIDHIDIIFKEAEDFSIWRKDGSLDELRFKYMLDILKEEGKI